MDEIRDCLIIFNITGAYIYLVQTKTGIILWVDWTVTCHRLIPLQACSFTGILSGLAYIHYSTPCQMFLTMECGRKYPKFRDLVKSLPSIVLQRKALATVKKYAGAFSRWKSGLTLSLIAIVAFPAKPFHLALYMSKSVRISAPVYEAVNSLSWVHTLAVVEDPMIILL